MMLVADSSAWILFFVALGLAIVILLRRSYRYFGRRSERDAPVVHVPPDPVRWDPRPSDLSAELMRQQVQMHETARQLTARLDNKIRVLQYLTATAEQQIGRLESLLEQARQQDKPQRFL